MAAGQAGAARDMNGLLAEYARTWQLRGSFVETVGGMLRTNGITTPEALHEAHVDGRLPELMARAREGVEARVWRTWQGGLEIALEQAARAHQAHALAASEALVVGRPTVTKWNRVTTLVIPGDMAASVAHVEQVFARLEGSPGLRSHACAPLHRGDQARPHYAFPDLHAAGYVNVPPAEAGRARDYVRALARLVVNLHAAGIYHNDLFPSNIFHREAGEGPDAVHLVLIDWDTATMEGEEGLMLALALPKAPHDLAEPRHAAPMWRFVDPQRPDLGLADRFCVLALAFSLADPELWAQAQPPLRMASSNAGWSSAHVNEWFQNVQDAFAQSLEQGGGQRQLPEGTRRLLASDALHRVAEL